MKQLLAMISFLIVLLQCEAQLSNTMPSAAAAPDTSTNPGSKTLSRYQLKKPTYNVSVGMDFSTASGYGSGFTQYVIPRVSYPLGKKIIVSGGIVIANTNYFNARPLFSGESFQPYNGNYTSLTVFGSGTYLVNDRLTISGAFYKEFPVAGKQLTYSPYYPISQQGSQGFNVNLQYRIGRNAFIQAGFEMNQGRDRYSINPFAPHHTHGFGDIDFGGIPQSLYNIFSGF